MAHIKPFEQTMEKPMDQQSEAFEQLVQEAFEANRQLAQKYPEEVWERVYQLTTLNCLIE